MAAYKAGFLFSIRLFSGQRKYRVSAKGISARGVLLCSERFWLLLQRGMLGEERVDRFLRIDDLLHQREDAGRL